MSQDLDMAIGDELLLDSDQWIDYWIGGELLVEEEEAGISPVSGTHSHNGTEPSMSKTTATLPAVSAAHNHPGEKPTGVGHITVSPIGGEHGHVGSLPLPYIPVALYPVSGSHARSEDTPELANVKGTGDPVDGTHGQDGDVPEGAFAAVLSVVSGRHGHAGSEVLSYFQPTLLPVDGAHGHSGDTVGISYTPILDVVDGAHGRSAVLPQWAFIGFPLSVAMDGSDRRLTWEGNADTVYVITDGEVYGSTSGNSFKIRDSYTIREILKAGKANDDVQWEAILQTPLDEVHLSWTGDAHEEPGGYYRAEIRPDGGDWSGLTSTQSQSYTTDPLEDGTYDLRIIAVDAEGDESESDTATITISSAPEPPSGIEWEFDSTTQTLTVTWEESPSGDVDTYPVRSSAGEEVLDLNADPVQETSDLSYEKTFTEETGVWLILVRAKDSDGHEEGNLSQMIRVDIRDGHEHGNPADPRFVEAGPAPGGKAKLTWEYMPMFEEGSAAPGVAQEARIYGNGGAGDVDWTTPIDTISMDGPTSAQSMSWESGELEAGTYSYGVRIATDTHPDGVESDSKRVVSADVDGDVPAEPSLSVTKV